ncbi:hypothetical protein P9112_007525 [Eukaryota sp. TZLM1-RC]
MTLSLFCETCGTLFQLGSSGVLHCPCCKSMPPATDGVLQKTVIHSNLKPFAYSFEDANAEPQRQDAVIDEQCPECGHDRMSFRTLQMRGVDEGATVFYTCLKCEYTFKVNN